MFPLPVHTVQHVLQYVSPLSDPLPPHLLSTPLRQRHTFLQISPSSPVEYLCWPDPDNATAIDLLDRLPPDLSDLPSFPTRYTSDTESTFAHVQISSHPQDLRMLFHWDDIHGWKYHDLRLMPFPSPSFSTPQLSLANSPPPLSSPDHGNDDSYWDAYGEVERGIPSPPGSTDVVGEEDAYWAQYTSVHGSADSTIPSPLPTRRKHRQDSIDDGSPSSFSLQMDPIMDIPVSTFHSRPLASALGPSPITLAHLLSKISPRKEVYSPVLDDPNSSQSPSVECTATDSELITPLLPSGSPADPAITVKLNGVPLSKCLSHSRAEDKALTDSIKGLYCLWRTRRKGESDDKDRSAFLQVVQAAIAHE